jgi:hypothetical protein
MHYLFFWMDQPQAKGHTGTCGFNCPSQKDGDEGGNAKFPPSLSVCSPRRDCKQAFISETLPFGLPLNMEF